MDHKIPQGAFRSLHTEPSPQLTGLVGSVEEYTEPKQEALLLDCRVGTHRPVSPPVLVRREADLAPLVLKASCGFAHFLWEPEV